MLSGCCSSAVAMSSGCAVCGPEMHVKLDACATTFALLNMHWPSCAVYGYVASASAPPSVIRVWAAAHGQPRHRRVGEKKFNGSKKSIGLPTSLASLVANFLAVFHGAVVAAVHHLLRRQFHQRVALERPRRLQRLDGGKRPATGEKQVRRKKTGLRKSKAPSTSLHNFG